MFVDTNVLVYATAKGAPHREQARAAIAHYAATGETLCISRQVLREFLAVVTRPQTWAQAQTATQGASTALNLARDFEILEDGPQVWDQLVALCRNFVFGGRQVHDANIVATMLAHGETGLLTFNIADFQRFASVINLLPLVTSI
jgi:predicted nucleic acid-binding protein